MLLQIEEPGALPDIPVGIDFGTTNSAVATVINGKAVLLADHEGALFIPTVAALTPSGAVVGIKALEYPQAVKSVKRHMGTPGMVLPEGHTVLEVAVLILRHLRERAEAALKRPLGKVVITVPAYFDDTARQSVKDAALMAGLQVRRLINEPTAAALAYGLDKEVNGYYAVYDFGGGTFDVSVLRMENSIFQVLATGGDTQLGGDDIDMAIAAKLGCGKTVARSIKEWLCANSEDAVWISPYGYQINQSELRETCRPIIDRTLAITADVLEQSGIAKAALNGIILVGGSTYMPYIRARVAEFFGQTPLTDLNPEEIVALGAARQADALLYGTGSLLLDVAPLSLGIETYGGLTEKIIPRNTPVPAVFAQDFTTYADGQTAMDLHVVQGEREFAGDCRSLARFRLDGIPPMQAGAARIRVTYRLDEDGILTVEAQENTTGIRQQVTVRPTYGLAPEQIEEMLKDAYTHGGEDLQQRLQAQAGLDAQTLIRAVTHALAEDGDLLTAQERADIESCLDTLRGLCATAGSSQRQITDTMERLTAISQDFAGRRMQRAVETVLLGHNTEEVLTQS